MFIIKNMASHMETIKSVLTASNNMTLRLLYISTLYKNSYYLKPVKIVPWCSVLPSAQTVLKVTVTFARTSAWFHHNIIYCYISVISSPKNSFKGNLKREKKIKMFLIFKRIPVVVYLMVEGSYDYLYCDLRGIYYFWLHSIPSPLLQGKQNYEIHIQYFDKLC